MISVLFDRPRSLDHRRWQEQMHTAADQIEADSTELDAILATGRAMDDATDYGRNTRTVVELLQRADPRSIGRCGTAHRMHTKWSFKEITSAKGCGGTARRGRVGRANIPRMRDDAGASRRDDQQAIRYWFPKALAKFYIPLPDPAPIRDGYTYIWTVPIWPWDIEVIEANGAVEVGDSWLEAIAEQATALGEGGPTECWSISWCRFPNAAENGTRSPSCWTIRVRMYCPPVDG